MHREVARLSNASRQFGRHFRLLAPLTIDPDAVMLTQSEGPFLNLQSLGLYSPSLPLTRVYDDILKSSSWPPRLAVLGTLGDNAQDPHGSHRVIQDAWGSTGCVNALDWERGSQCRLASAGDDTKINIWSPGLDQTSNDEHGDGGQQHAPKLRYVERDN